MNILAIDTSTEACSAALLRADGEIFSEFEYAPRQHNRLLPGMMDRVLAAAAIDRIELSHCAFANGPGAFTGIRIAAAQAQGIGIALGIPLLPISTLAVLAQACFLRNQCDRVLVALDARMQQIYWATYMRDSDSCARLDGSEYLTSEERVDIDARVDCGVGHGWLDGLRQRVNFEVDSTLLPEASALLKLAALEATRNRGIAATDVRINYLRNQITGQTRR